MFYKCFTLIEMLVTIAIIAILAGLISSPIYSAIESSRRTSCMNNIRQCGVSVMAYVNERAQFPQAANMAKSVPTASGLLAIPEALVPYSDPNTFCCPSDNSPYSGYTGSNAGKTLFQVDLSSYDWNTRLNNSPRSVRGRAGSVANLSNVWFLFDTLPNHGKEVARSSSAVTDDLDNDRTINENVRNIGYLDLTTNGL